MGGRKVATTVYLTPEQDSKLKILSRILRTPVAELVRRGVDMIVSENAELLVPAEDDRVKSKSTVASSRKVSLFGRDA